MERLKTIKRLALIFISMGVIHLLVGLIIHLVEASKVTLTVLLIIGASAVIAGSSLGIGALIEEKKVSSEDKVK